MDNGPRDCCGRESCFIVTVKISHNYFINPSNLTFPVLRVLLKQDNQRDFLLKWQTPMVSSNLHVYYQMCVFLLFCEDFYDCSHLNVLLKSTKCQ